MRLSIPPRAAFTATASSFCGMCFGQFTSHASWNHDGPLGARGVALGREPREEIRVAFDDAGAPPG